MSKFLDIARRFTQEATPVSTAEKLKGAAAAFFALLATGLVARQFLGISDMPLIVASMGASSLLIFAASHSPMAQPWPVLGGHIISALVGVACAHTIPNPVLAGAAAVALSIFCMQMLRCLHPPAGATTLVPVIGSAKVHALGYAFVLTPLALNLAVLLPMGILLNNLLPGRRYPAAFFAPKVQTHAHDNPAPLDRLGISEQDLQSALTELNSYLDISRDDLNQIYNRAGMLAYQRKLGEITCADIMSRDLSTAEFATELEEIWEQLHVHKIKAIPVIDRANRVIGIVTMIDFLRNADLKTHHTLREKLLNLVRRTAGVYAEKPEVAGQIMASPVVTVREDMHIVQLVPLLSDRGLHHIPVVNAENRLVGMVTQSDLVAALYRGQLAGN